MGILNQKNSENLAGLSKANLYQRFRVHSD